MLIIYPYAQVLEESTWDLKEWSEVCERWLWSKGKLTPSRSWSLRWKRDNWTRALSTRTFYDSLGKDIEDYWISLAADSHASRSHFVEVKNPPKTLDTFGPIYYEESLFANLDTASSKTSKESLAQNPKATTRFSTMSSATWSEWVTGQRQASSRRLKSARRIKEKDGLSWPTPLCHLAKETASPAEWERKSPSLLCMALMENWPTPTVAEGGKISCSPNFGQIGLSNHPKIQGTPEREKQEKSKNGLPTQGKNLTDGKSRGLLNPDWVDTLMGFPAGWTDLEL
jgi:hypothetical protein